MKKKVKSESEISIIDLRKVTSLKEVESYRQSEKKKAKYRRKLYRSLELNAYLLQRYVKDRFTKGSQNSNNDQNKDDHFYDSVEQMIIQLVMEHFKMYLDQDFGLGAIRIYAIFREMKDDLVITDSKMRHLINRILIDLSEKSKKYGELNLTDLKEEEK